MTPARRTRVLTIGTFDLLHPGHLELLAECRRVAGPDGLVMVGLNRDDFVERFKGHAPRQTLAERIEIIEALRDVDAVLVNSGDEDARFLIEATRPHFLGIGDDWLDPGHDQARYLAQLGVVQAWIDEHGVRILYFARTRGTSSSHLRAAS